MVTAHGQTLGDGLWLILMARAPPDVPGLMGIFPTVAEMLFLEELAFHSFSVDRFGGGSVMLRDQCLLWI